jgi:hypothetical protein
VPLTVKFSEQFYRKLGHEAVDELVNWLNQVDTAYRGELREINESNFARFESKLESGLARLEGGLLARIGQAEGRLARMTLALWVATLATLVALLKF